MNFFQPNLSVVLSRFCFSQTAAMMMMIIMIIMMIDHLIAGSENSSENEFMLGRPFPGRKL